MKVSENKLHRIEHANAIILSMSGHGRRFFYNSKHDRVARFEIDSAGRLRFRDEYTDKCIALIHGGKWRGFTNGGTMRAIIEDLAQYIRTGKKIRNHFGPWPDWICDGDLWGYGDDAGKVRAEVSVNPALRQASSLAKEREAAQ